MQQGSMIHPAAFICHSRIQPILFLPLCCLRRSEQYLPLKFLFTTVSFALHLLFTTFLWKGIASD